MKFYQLKVILFSPDKNVKVNDRFRGERVDSFMCQMV